MRAKLYYYQTFLTAILIALTASSSAFAVLGGEESRLAREAGFESHSITRRSSYVLHEAAHPPSRQTLHQFAGTDGKIFGVAWRGPTHPDLRPLLGSYFDAYQNAMDGSRLRRRGRHPIILEVQTPQGPAYLEVGGHFGSVYGRLLLKDKIPSGVDLNELR